MEKAKGRNKLKMTRRAFQKHRELFRFLVLGLLIALVSSTPASKMASGRIHQAFQVDDPASTENRHAGLQGILVELVQEYETHGLHAAGDLARKRGIGLSGDKVEVVLVVRDRSSFRLSELTRYDVEVLATYGDLLLVALPIHNLPKEEMGISWIRLPFKPLPCVVSEGVSLTNAFEWHERGITGESAKVAVIDLGFVGLWSAVAAGELPADIDTVDYSGSGMESATSHGVAVAEVVHDMAPGAHLTLINTTNEVDLGNAKDYCITNGIHIINHSVGYANTGGYDGTGLICDMANDANASGILWVNAAGNHAHMHYRGVFFDSNSDSLHEFGGSAGTEINTIGYLYAGTPVWCYLSWNRWPTTDQDYDLYLYGHDGFWSVLDSSCTRQSGSQPPTEEIPGFAAPFDGWYGVGIRKFDAEGEQEMTLFNAYQHFEYETTAGSLLAPADATGAIAVAAIAKENWETGPQESFSSQGPTYDGRMKPDISGPDRVVNWTYGGFGGTSAASPHIAGAAALVKSAFPAWTATEIRACLEAHAVDMGEAGQDSLFGWGRLDLPLSIDAVGPPPRDFALSLSWGMPNPFSRETRIEYMLPVAGDVTLSVHNIAGQMVTKLVSCTQEPGSYGCVWNGLDCQGRLVGSGIYFLRVMAGGDRQTKPVLFLP